MYAIQLCIPQRLKWRDRVRGEKQPSLMSLLFFSIESFALLWNFNVCFSFSFYFFSCFSTIWRWWFAHSMSLSRSFTLSTSSLCWTLFRKCSVLFHCFSTLILLHFLCRSKMFSVPPYLNRKSLDSIFFVVIRPAPIPENDFFSLLCSVFLKWSKTKYSKKLHLVHDCVARQIYTILLTSLLSRFFLIKIN